jgi:hypothetical protein
LGTVFERLDLILFLAFSGAALIVDHVRRTSLSKRDALDFAQENEDPAERNIAANVAARSLQGGLTVGGFLFAGMFAAIVQGKLDRWQTDLLWALMWTSLSLIFGAWNMAGLPQRSVVKNVALLRSFVTLNVLQLAGLLAAFCRLGILILKYCGYVSP